MARLDNAKFEKLLERSMRSRSKQRMDAGLALKEGMYLLRLGVMDDSVRRMLDC